MKTAISLALVAGLLIAAPAAYAQGAAPPDGSYKSSCVQISVKANWLSARCRGEYGLTRWSDIPLPCNDSIRNHNGYLACSRGSELAQGELLGTGQYLVAPNRQFYAIQQSDGNLCVYKGSAPDDNWSPQAVWCSKKTAPGGEFIAAVQADGNLCTYEGTKPYARYARWCNQHTASGGRFFLAMQNDGNLCVYMGSPDAKGGGVWCHAKPVHWTDRVPDGSYRQTCTAQIWSEKLSACCGNGRDPGCNSTSLDLPCRGSIENHDGKLVCVPR